ncbi:hypothetical protein CO661_01845 [Sinorhizobium fredii]|uniref:Uncharacterized protein n=1 Tax=Rhizobium fredii TaxID=380 RepID=A0A2A6M7I8_RHIFR|nr:hypothetical protein CO661_01845 [Sinorhizobium fredii]
MQDSSAANGLSYSTRSAPFRRQVATFDLLRLIDLRAEVRPRFAQAMLPFQMQAKMARSVPGRCGRCGGLAGADPMADLCYRLRPINLRMYLSRQMEYQLS